MDSRASTFTRKITQNLSCPTDDGYRDGGDRGGGSMSLGTTPGSTADTSAIGSLAGYATSSTSLEDEARPSEPLMAESAPVSRRDTIKSVYFESGAYAATDSARMTSSSGASTVRSVHTMFYTARQSMVSTQETITSTLARSTTNIAEPMFPGLSTASTIAHATLEATRRPPIPGMMAQRPVQNRVSYPVHTPTLSSSALSSVPYGTLPRPFLRRFPTNDVSVLPAVSEEEIRWWQNRASCPEDFLTNTSGDVSAMSHFMASMDYSDTCGEDYTMHDVTHERHSDWDAQLLAGSIESERFQSSPSPMQDFPLLPPSSVDCPSRPMSTKIDNGGEQFTLNMLTVAVTLNAMPDPARLRKRRLAAMEILTTEHSYHDGLRFLHDNYMKPIQRSLASSTPLLSSAEFRCVFGCLLEVMTLSATILGWLTARLQADDTAGSAVPPWNPATDLLGDILKDIAPYLKAYSRYVQCYGKAIIQVKQSASSNPAFVRLLKDVSVRQKHRLLNIQAYLLLPVQRIPRYRLLIAHLIKYTDSDHPDYNNLTTAYDLIGEAADHVNEIVRRSEEQEFLIELQRLIKDLPEKLVSPSRRLLRRGSVLKVCRKTHKPREFFLFNDCLIYTSPISGASASSSSVGALDDRLYLFHRKIPLDIMKVVAVEDTAAIKHSFQVLSRDKSFLVYVATLDEKIKWVRAFTDAIGEYKQSRRTLLVDASAASSDTTSSVSSRPTSVYNAIQYASLPSSPIYSPSSPSILGSSNVPLNVVQDYKAPIWVPDEQAPACIICREEFNLVFRRKHHCRLCGRVICGRCSGKQFIVAVDEDGQSPERVERVCDECYDQRWGEGERSIELALEAEERARQRKKNSESPLVRRGSEGGGGRFRSWTTGSPTSPNEMVADPLRRRSDGVVASDQFGAPIRFQRGRASTEAATSSTGGCALCQLDFSLFRRRHNCCRCKRHFCQNCLSKKPLLPTDLTVAERLAAGLIGAGASEGAAGLRMCDPCYIGIDPAFIQVASDGAGWTYTVVMEGRGGGAAGEPNVEPVPEEDE